MKVIADHAALRRRQLIVRRPCSGLLTLVTALPPIVVAALASIGLVVAACGGAGGGPGSPAASPTAPQPAAAAAAVAAATAYLEARTQALVQGTPAQALRRLCAPQSGLADLVLWWAAGTRASRRGREIGVPPQGYPSASVKVTVRRVTADAQTGTASVMAYTTPGPGDLRNVDSSAAFHLVTVVRSAGGGWLASGDASTAYDRDVPVFLRSVMNLQTNVTASAVTAVPGVPHDPGTTSKEGAR